MSSDNCETAVANFIQKTFQILENKQFENIIHWMPNGREFAIKEIDEFQDMILPKFFRHRNINSFIRQLNMYGFHKSRKDPSKNIFSHPCFLKSCPQILHQVRRKIKNEEKNDEEVKQTPAKRANIENEEPTAALVQQQPIKSFTVVKEPVEGIKEKDKQIYVTKTEFGHVFVGSVASFGLSQVSPFKGLMEKSCVMDSNPEMYLRMRDNKEDEEYGIIEDEDDNISIQDQIERERRIYQNRKSGVTILHTINLLDDQDFQ